MITNEPKEIDMVDEKAGEAMSGHTKEPWRWEVLDRSEAKIAELEND